MPSFRDNVFDHAPELKGESSIASFQVRCFGQSPSKLSSYRILPNPKRSSSAGRATVLSSPLPRPVSLMTKKASKLQRADFTAQEHLGRPRVPAFLVSIGRQQVGGCCGPRCSALVWQWPAASSGTTLYSFELIESRSDVFDASRTGRLGSSRSTGSFPSVSGLMAA